MNPEAHLAVSQHAISILRTIEGDPSLYSSPATMPKSVSAALQGAIDGCDAVARGSFDIDFAHDLELVDVEGPGAGAARDDPHKDEWLAVDDVPFYEKLGAVFTRYSHFIDIKKGPGIFDDYDGYGYFHGSACRDEFQTAANAASTLGAKALAAISGRKVDAGIAWWFNDAYVHAPGQPWYRPGRCSAALERYSFPADKGRFKTVADECAARFPLVGSVGAKDAGYPYSVFPPVDNMARYWYAQYVNGRRQADIGPVMHAIQDASVPHHAAGYLGNWHSEYETDHEKRLAGWLTDSTFTDEVVAVLRQIEASTDAAPAPLGQDDWMLVPAKDWEIDALVTWTALHGYHEYDATYGQFRSGYRFDEASSRRLTVLATAICTLVLQNLR
jgi:hypothetical protein